ncbi:hypothetical protein [Janibacter melonis]|uniref:hypothetical protein n=1 Tax=Janibacter melonis TaxID=262209 RepID=UPI00174CE23F|nr:hypothetical protein [Janibacter melonis]
MQISDLAPLAGIPATLLGLLSIEGLTAQSRARRRVKAAADVVTALPEGTSRDLATEILHRETEHWRRRSAPTYEESRLAFRRRYGIVTAVMGIAAVGIIYWKFIAAEPLSDGWYRVVLFAWLFGSTGVLFGIVLHFEQRQLGESWDIKSTPPSSRAPSATRTAARARRASEGEGPVESP